MVYIGCQLDPDLVLANPFDAVLVLCWCCAGVVLLVWTAPRSPLPAPRSPPSSGPLADFDVVGQLLSRKKLPEFRCKPNPTRSLYLVRVGAAERLKMDGVVWHYTLDAGWQKIWAKCFAGCGLS